MSETTFTPGPWRVDADEHTNALDIVGSDPRIQLATIMNPEQDDLKPDDVEFANAALISAAPELYEALWGLREAVRGQDICDCQGSPDCPITMAEKALAKARGEAS